MPENEQEKTDAQAKAEREKAEREKAEREEALLVGGAAAAC